MRIRGLGKGGSSQLSKVVRRPLTQRCLERMRIPCGYWRVKIDRLSDGPHKRIVMRYMRRIDDAVKAGYGIVLCGENDSGKTSIASMILQEARRRGYSGLFLTTQQYLAECEGGTLFDDAQTLQERSKNVDVLVLDDLGKEVSKYGTSTAGHERGVVVARFFDDLIRTRQSNMRSTVITTNLFPDMIRKKYGVSFCNLFKERFGVVEIIGHSQRKIEGDLMVKFFSKD